MDKIYYLYRHIRLDKNQVFYIGIGTIPSENILKQLGRTHKSFYRRAYDKVKSRNAHWKNIVNKTDYEIEIILETHSIKLIKKKEIEFIELYKDTLCNMTEGGGGIEGYNHTEETKLKIGNASRNRKQSEEHKRKVNEAKLKPVIMYNDNEEHEFKSCTDAAKFLGNINYRGNISTCLSKKGTRKMVQGYKFKFKEERDERRRKQIND